MKKTSLLILALFMILPLAVSCDKATASKDGDKLNIVTTIFPPFDFARQIGGDKVDTSMLLSPGGEIHFYEASLSDLKKIQSADIFVYIGGESDAWVNNILDSIDKTKVKVISMLEVVETVEENDEGILETNDDHGTESHEDELEHEVEYDEHVWTSPKNAITLTNAISNAMCELDGDNAESYKSGTKSFVEKLTSLDEKLRSIVNSGVRNTLVFSGRFPFRYLCDEYGLKYYAAFAGCSSESEPSLSTISSLISTVKGNKIPSVFYIEFANESVADTICEATGAKKLLLHSCHNVSEKDFENGVTYLDLMEQNAQNLKEALN